MKILVVSNGIVSSGLQTEDQAVHLSSAANDLNYESEVFFHGAHLAQNKTLRFWQLANKKLHQKTGMSIFKSAHLYLKRKDDAALIHKIKIYKPKIVVVMKGMYITPDFMKELRNSFPEVKFVNICIDNIFLYSDVFLSVPYYDRVYITDTYLKERFERLGYDCGYFPKAVNEKFYQPLSEADRNLMNPDFYSDINMVGGFYPYRAAILECLSEFDFKWWGPLGNYGDFSNLHHFSGWKNHQKKSVGGLLKRQIFSNSKINITTHDPVESIRSDNTRIYQTAALKGFQIVEYNKDLENSFEIGEELEVFTGPKDLKDKVQFYLNHDQKRMDMIEKCYDRVLKEHTHCHRLQTIVKDLFK